MQKYILYVLVAIIGTGIAVNAIANDVELQQRLTAMKVATIEKMYQQDVSTEGMDNPIVLQQYSNPELKAAFQLADDYFDREQLNCGIDYDVLWDSQDPDYSQNKQFAVTEQGLVKVSLAQGSNIYYELSCDDSVCKIADVVLVKNISLKAHLLQSCQ
ncbi:hypothetical protein KPY62_00780 [Psychrobacter sp. TAE2020]|uniref:hypothetical protein n=1 Tax=Psychrobacter sp. TAE2020 TaxID=2846762 RepID=UPI001C0FD2B4|nr:hypothetical protein [Psychrobacter sp. TAE2020]MBU5615657.1 hypothetical protein [Psychrobacter sp. TAE2020]